MKKKRNEINAKLKQLGQLVNLNDNDIAMAKMTMGTMMGMIIITGIVTIFSKILCSQLDPSGLYYLIPSDIRTGMLSRFI